MGAAWFWWQHQQNFRNDLGMEFVRIPAGSFMMGSLPSEPGRSGLDDEERFQVTLNADYYLQRTEVTQAQWLALMPNNPSRFQGDLQRPVENVSYLDVQEYLARLNANHTGLYRLPTEAEWEYAARAGQESAYFFGNQPKRLSVYAWYRDNADRTTHPVASKAANPWKLFDIYGNVSEWVEDWYDDYPKPQDHDPHGPLEGLNRVIRGGNWIFSAKFCRSARRHSARPGMRNPGIGFRLLWEPQP